MDCKVRVKAQEKYGKGADYKEKVKEEGRIDKADFCEVLVKPARKAAAGGRIAGSIGRAVAAKQENRNPTGSIRREAARNARGENDNRRRK